MITPQEVSNALDISSALQSVVTAFTSQVTTAGPIILGAVAVGVAVTLGIKWFRKFASKVG